MYSTVQQTAYFVPTARRTPHPSQAAFDSTASLTVLSMPAERMGANNTWSKGYGRSCWTADNSRYIHNQSHHPAQQNNKQPIVVQAQPGYRRACTSIGPHGDSGYTLTMPSTAALPRRGQVKLTSLKECVTPKSQRAKTVAPNVRKKRKVHEPVSLASSKHSTIPLGSLGALTMADLHSVIDTEFPETQGLAFNRASQYIRTTTAELMKAHSRPTSQASRGGTPLVRPRVTEPGPVPIIRSNNQPVPMRRNGAEDQISGALEDKAITTTPDIGTDNVLHANLDQTTEELETNRNSAGGLMNIRVPTS